MNTVFYSMAFRGSKVAPVQLARSLQSLRLFDRQIRVVVFLFGQPPPGFLELLSPFNAEVRLLGDQRSYIARTEPDRAEFFALDPKIHRWLVLEEPELRASSRILYIDSDTLFFAPASSLFSRYADADLYAREEPFCRRSPQGYDPTYIDEDALSALRVQEGLAAVPPFNTGVCLFTRQMADRITSILPRYFEYLFRFIASFEAQPAITPTNDPVQMVYERHLRSSPVKALPFPSQNPWIVDQVALWLALGQFRSVNVEDFASADVWQGGEFQQMSPATPFPLLCHYFGDNTEEFFQRLERLSPEAARHA